MTIINPNIVKPPFVSFERVGVYDREKSEETGYYCTKDVDYIYVTPAGTKDRYPFIAERFIADKKALSAKGDPYWSKYWEPIKKSYEAWKNGQDVPVDGTPIKAWPLLSPARQKVWEHANFRTVEEMAEANEEGLANVGMGARAEKEKARSWLKTRADTSKVASDNAGLKEKLEAAEERLQANEDLIRQLKSQLDRLSNARIAADPVEEGEEISAAEILDKPKRGRPRKAA